MQPPTQGSPAAAYTPTLADFKALAAADTVRSELLEAIDPEHNSTADWDTRDLEAK